jgi:hypothetical protein
VEDFLDRYVEPHRRQSLEEYGTPITVQNAQAGLEKWGYVMITKHNSTTGEMVTYSPTWCEKEA